MPLSWNIIEFKNGPEHDKSNKMMSVPNKDSDQPGHLPSLIRILAVRFMGSSGPKHSPGSQRRLRSDRGGASWSESLLAAQVILLFLLCSGWNDFSYILNTLSLLFPGIKWNFSKPHVSPEWPHTRSEGKLIRIVTKPTKWLCTQQRLRSAWASAQSDQSLCCPHEETLSP